MASLPVSDGMKTAKSAAMEGRSVARSITYAAAILTTFVGASLVWGQESGAIEPPPGPTELETTRNLPPLPESVAPIDVQNAATPPHHQYTNRFSIAAFQDHPILLDSMTGQTWCLSASDAETGSALQWIPIPLRNEPGGCQGGVTGSLSLAAPQPKGSRQHAPGIQQAWEWVNRMLQKIESSLSAGIVLQVNVSSDADRQLPRTCTWFFRPIPTIELTFGTCPTLGRSVRHDGGGDPGLGLEGYCPVELRENERWRRGDKRYYSVYHGRKYFFSTQEAQEQFLAAPEQYAPVLGGDDIVAWVEDHKRVPGRREHGAFYDGGVYLFASGSSYKKFQRDPSAYANEAEQMEPLGE